MVDQLIIGGCRSRSRLSTLHRGGWGYGHVCIPAVYPPSLDVTSVDGAQNNRRPAPPRMAQPPPHRPRNHSRKCTVPLVCGGAHGARHALADPHACASIQDSAAPPVERGAVAGNPRVPLNDTGNAGYRNPGNYGWRYAITETGIQEKGTRVAASRAKILWYPGVWVSQE